jgi:hypothetical protein
LSFDAILQVNEFHTSTQETTAQNTTRIFGYSDFRISNFRIFGFRIFIFSDFRISYFRISVFPDLIFPYFRMIPTRFRKKDLICKFLQSGSVRINCFVYISACMHLLFLARLPKAMHSTISILFYISCMKDWKDCDFNNVFNVLTKYQV